jgi:DNA invertase Pin-like site-specific DNA recombinase
MKAIYVRISTANQKFERQMKEEKNVKYFIDVASGHIPFQKRPEALKLMHDDTITCIEVKEVSRLGRNLGDTLNTIYFFMDKGVDIYISNQGLHTLLPDGKKNPTAMLVVSILGSCAEQETELLKERTREGQALAKLKGHYKGKPRGAKTKRETLLATFHRTIMIAQPLLDNGKSINAVVQNLAKHNELLSDENKLKGANRVTITRLVKLGILKSKSE